MPEFNRPWITITLLLTTGILFGSIIFAGIKIVEKNSRITSIKASPLSNDANESIASTPIPKWKIFESTEFGITFNYPNNWPEPEVLQLLQGIKINLNNILSISTSSNFPTNLSFQDYMIAEYEGKIAFTNKADGTIEITIVFPHPYAKNQFLIITYLEEAEVVDVIEEILSTLEFIDSPAITITSAIENLPEPTVNPTKSSSSIPTNSGFVPTPTFALFPTPTPFTLPTPDPTTFDATQEECIYGCIPESKFQ